jgi:hypothetical protein
MSLARIGNTYSVIVETPEEAKEAKKEIALEKKALINERKGIALQMRSVRSNYTAGVRQRGSKFRGGKGVGRFVRDVQTATRDNIRRQMQNQLSPLEYRLEEIELCLISLEQADYKMDYFLQYGEFPVEVQIQPEPEPQSKADIVLTKVLQGCANFLEWYSNQWQSHKRRTIVGTGISLLLLVAIGASGNSPPQQIVEQSEPQQEQMSAYEKLEWQKARNTAYYYPKVKQEALARGIPIQEMEESHDSLSPVLLENQVTNWISGRCLGEENPEESTNQAISEQQNLYLPGYPWNELVEVAHTIPVDCQDFSQYLR